MSYSRITVFLGNCKHMAPKHSCSFKPVQMLHSCIELVQKQSSICQEPVYISHMNAKAATRTLDIAQQAYLF